MTVLGIDPGPEKSAFCRWDGERVVHSGIEANALVKDSIAFMTTGIELVAIEMVACFGMAVGADVFETVFWVGRFFEASPIEPSRVYRKDVKMHFCQSMRAKDANIRQALIDRFGGQEKAIGKKATQGPLYGVKSHIWAALSVALYAADKHHEKN